MAPPSDLHVAQPLSVACLPRPLWLTLGNAGVLEPII